MRKDDIYEGFLEGSDQLDPADSLTGQIGEDPLDAGYSPPDREPVATRWSSTEEDILHGPSLDVRLSAEEPDIAEDTLDTYDENPRAGRLVSPDEGAHSHDESQAIASDVGRAGWASTAEEAAMHIVEEGNLDDGLETERVEDLVKLALDG